MKKLNEIQLKNISGGVCVADIGRTVDWIISQGEDLGVDNVGELMSDEGVQLSLLGLWNDANGTTIATFAELRQEIASCGDMKGLINFVNEVGRRS